jgi:antitoxin VapB
MKQTATIFLVGECQAIRLPEGIRFDCDEVFIWRDELSGNVILSSYPLNDWDGFVRFREKLGPVPTDFLVDRDLGTN